MTTNNFEDILEQHGLNYCKFTMSGMSHEEVKNKYKKHMKKFKSNENKEIKQITDIYFDGSYMCKAKMKEDNTIKDVTFPIIDVKGNILVCLKDLEYMLKGKISLIQDVLQKLGNYTKKEPKKRKPREQKEITIEVANDKESQTQQTEVEALDKLEDLFPDEIYKDLKKHYSMESKNGLETEEVVTTDIDTKQDAEKSHLPLKPNECQNKAMSTTNDDINEDKAKDVSAETNVSADQSNEFTVMNEQKMLYMECETAPESPITNPADKANEKLQKEKDNWADCSETIDE